MFQVGALVDGYEVNDTRPQPTGRFELGGSRLGQFGDPAAAQLRIGENLRRDRSAMIGRHRIDSAGDLQHAEAAISQGKRVWAVYGHAGQSGEPKALVTFFAGTKRLGAPKLVQVAGTRIVIALYEPSKKVAAF